ADRAPHGLRVPILGYVARSIPPELRPVLGFPNAAAVGRPMPLPERVTRIDLSPSYQYALVEMKLGATLGLIYLNQMGRPGTIDSVACSWPHADQLSFSPRGSSVVLFSRAHHALQVIGGLPVAPYLVREIDVAWLGDQRLKLAISDDAGVVIATTLGGAVPVLFTSGGADNRPSLS